MLTKIGKHKVIDCVVCEFAHLKPFPSENDLNEFYKAKYYQEKRAELHEYRKEVRELPWLRLCYEDRLSVFNNHVITTDNEPKKLLDVGCGNGLFLRFMKENGWDVLGIEPSLMAYDIAKSLGVEVLNERFEEFIEDNRFNHSFHAINLRFVLEHVPKPKEFLECCKNLLMSNGVLCVESPNDFNILQIEAQKQLHVREWWVAIPEHVNYFNFQSLEKLLLRTGFEVILKMASFPMEIFLLMGENYVQNRKVGKKCHLKRMKLELGSPSDTRRSLYEKLSEFRLGRTCIVYGKLRG